MKRNITLVFLLVVLVILVFFSYQIVKPFLMPVFTAGILTIAFYPIHRRIARLIRKPGTAALVSTLLALLLTLVPLVGIGVVVTNELTDFYQTLSQKKGEEGGWGPFFDHLIEEPLDWFSRLFPLSKDEIKAGILKRLKEASAWILAQLGAVIGSLASLFFNVLITYLVLFFFLRDGQNFTRSLIESLPLLQEHSERILRGIGETVTANVYGVLGVAMVQGALMTLGFLILGLPSPAVWGIVTAFVSMIPLIGTALIWVPAIFYLVIQGAYVKAVLMGVWGGVFVGMADNIVRPLLVGTRVRLYPLVIIFSLLGGTKAFGLVGLILGPVVVTMLIAIFNTLQEVLKEWEQT